MQALGFSFVKGNKGNHTRYGATIVGAGVAGGMLAHTPAKYDPKLCLPARGKQNRVDKLQIVEQSIAGRHFRLVKMT